LDQEGRRGDGPRLRGPRPGWIAALLVMAGALGVASVFAFSAGAAAADPIGLVINGVDVDCDVPPLLIKGRTLVPVRVVSEYLGATVGWDPANQRVDVEMPGRKVVLTIGSAEASVDGKTVELDSPACVVDGRTMVPIRFVSEALGAVVSWDGVTRTVTVESCRIVNLEWTKGEGWSTLVVQATGPITCTAAVTGGPGDGHPRIVLDVTPATLALPYEVLPINDPLVTRVRTGMLSTDPNVARLVVDLVEPVKYRLRMSESRTTAHLDIAHKVSWVGYQSRPDGKALVIKTTGPVEYETATLERPDRLVVDIKDVRPAEGLPDTIEVSSPMIRRIRIGQFKVDPDVVRVVVDLRHQVGYQVSAGDSGIEVYFTARVLGVELEEMPGRVRATVDADMPVVPRVMHLSDPHRLVVDVPHAVLAMDPAVVEAPGSAVEKVVASQFQRDPDVVRVVFYVPHYVGHRVAEGASDEGVAVDILVSSVVGKTIVVDAGHGGSDPGAIGPGGTMEKNINLSIAGIVCKMLEEAGARVVMTRTTDVTVDLFRRPEIANRTGADAFVSIHSNAFRADSKCGMEVFHYFNHPRSAELAELIHEEMQALGLNDRGVKTERFVVLRETRMPSALIEAAFLSNPEEERLLNDPAFQQRVARAVFNGLVRFFQ